MRAILAFFTLVLIGTACQADDPIGAGSESQSPGWIVGIGAVSAPDPFIAGAGNDVQWFPLVGYFGERLTWLGPSIRYRLNDSEALSIELLAEYRFEGIDLDDNTDPTLIGLNQRDGALEAGFELSRGPFWLTALADVSSTHKGFSAALGADHSIDITPSLSIGASLSVNWRSRHLANYYYGVTASESSAERSAYEIGSAISPRAGVDATWQFGKRSAFIVSVDAEFLPAEVTRSPIVNDQQQISVFAGFVVDLFK